MTGEEYVGSPAWVAWRRAIDLDDYEARFDRAAAAGENPHGEADFVMGFEPGSVLDAGCGFGRVAAELHARGVDVVGVDLDPDMIERARRRAPGLDFRVSDLADLDIGREFDLVVLAGNVLGYAAADRRAVAFAACADHVASGGHLVIGTQLQRDWPSLDEYRRWASDLDLDMESSFAGWDGRSYDGGGYVVMVFGRPDRTHATRGA